jgi:hypothetical protein
MKLTVGELKAVLAANGVEDTDTIDLIEIDGDMNLEDIEVSTTAARGVKIK